jgi:GDP-L-fucose synthase
MYFNIMRNAHRFGRLIFIGSGAVYDVHQPLTKITENGFDLSVPSDEHGFSKYIINNHIEKTDNAVDLRVFGVFGAYEDYAIRFISNAICKTLFDLPITIRQNRMFDYLFIDDLMPILEYFIHNKPAYRAYNVTPDFAVDLVTIAEMVLTRSRKDLPIIVGEPGMGPEYSGNNARLRSEIPTVTFTPLHEAIDRLYCWYESNKNLIDQRLLQVDR